MVIGLRSPATRNNAMEVRWRNASPRSDGGTCRFVKMYNQVLCNFCSVQGSGHVEQKTHDEICVRPSKSSDVASSQARCSIRRRQHEAGARFQLCAVSVSHSRHQHPTANPSGDGTNTRSKGARRKRNKGDLNAPLLPSGKMHLRTCPL